MVAQPVAVVDTTLRDQQIERVTERMIENANMASPTTGTPQANSFVDGGSTEQGAARDGAVEIKSEEPAEEVAQVRADDTPMTG